MPPHYDEAAPLGAYGPVPEFQEYMQNLSDEKFARLQDTYNSSNVSPNHSDFEGLLKLVEETLRAYKTRMEEGGRPSRLVDSTMRCALETALENCAAPIREVGFEVPTAILNAGPRLMEIFWISLEIDNPPVSEGHPPHSQGARASHQEAGRHPAESIYRRHPPHSQGARASQQQAGRHPAESSYPRPGPRTRGLPDQRRGPPPSNSYRNSGPSRQYGEAPRGYGRRQAPRGRYMEDSESDEGDW